MKRRFQHYHPYYKPSLWMKIKFLFSQILLPLICFQLIRTLFLPTTFDVILLTLMIVFYGSLKLRLI